MNSGNTDKVTELTSTDTNGAKPNTDSLEVATETLKELNDIVKLNHRSRSRRPPC